jgi:Xaa-Pro aminopeptidase
LAALGTDYALLFGAPERLRNGDAEYRYRPSSDVLYLTGWADPHCAVLLRPGAEQPFVMFVQPRDREMEVWSGRRPGPEGACETFGASLAYPIDELATRLPELLLGARTLHYRFAEDADRDRMLVGALAKARKLARRNLLDVPDAFVDPARLLHEQRLRKAPEEIAGYTTIVGGGANATVLHYISNDQPLRDGDLVCVDAGCEFQYYTADVTRTWPVNGRFTEAQRALYEVVLAAQKAAVDACRPGATFKGVHDLTTRLLTEGMVRLGLLPGDADDPAVIDDHIEKGRQKRYFPHGTSHWLGLDVHDVGAYSGAGRSRVLEPGMVLTVEPGLYVQPDDEDAPADLRGIGIRIEDDVLVTDSGPDVLTAGIPKAIDEVEAAVGGGVATVR